MRREYSAESVSAFGGRNDAVPRRSTLALGLMSRQAELAGVAHNIAHHAGSGLSCLSPHLAKALRAAGAATTQIDLLSDSPYPANASESEPLRAALESLRGTTLALLEKHGFAAGDVLSISLEASPAPWDKDGYSLHTRVVLISAAGRTYDSGWLQ